ncbi:MAG: dephospho-CoA kinase [Deltaproteobacteria bacterium]|nr:MAG: dephospho-CoA kinase [Deltaproteobacteria bacterium]
MMGWIIGLTGGIASGKSLVSRTLAELGVKVIDADEIGREIMAKDALVKEEVVRVFGDEVLKEAGEIDREKLGRIIFRDLNRRRILEEILHPRIQAQMWEKVQDCVGDVVLDVPLLIEKGEHEKVDVVVVVYIAREVQIQRLMRRDGISRDEAIMRIETQLPLEKKVFYAHYVINNNGSMEETREQAIRFYKSIRGKEVS